MRPRIDRPANDTAEGAAAEVVLRYTVTDDDAFTAEVDDWVTGLGAPGAGPGDKNPAVRATVLRPVVGNHADEWEIRLTFSSFEALGRLVDAHGGMVPVLPEDTEGRRWTPVEVDNPVLRHVLLPTSSTPGESDVPGT